VFSQKVENVCVTGSLFRSLTALLQLDEVRYRAVRWKVIRYVYNHCYFSAAVLSVSLVTAACSVLSLRMEETASRHGR
jgi:hypothetical protein